MKIGLLIGLFIYLSIGSIPARASDLSLSLDPPIATINAIAPANITSNLTIKNNSSSQADLKISLKPFKAKGENGELEYLSPEDFPMLKNIQILDNGIPVENIILSPDQEKKLTLNINILRDVTISDYYFSVIFTSQNNVNPTSNSSLNQIGIASNVLLSVVPLKTPDVIIEDFSSNLFLEKGPVPFTVKIKNKGAHFIRPTGEIIIKNMFGQTVGKIDLESVNILSDSIRIIPTASWNENFLLGLYVATLNISLPNSEHAFVRHVNFFAFPFRGLIIIACIATAIVIVRKKLISYLKK